MIFSKPDPVNLLLPGIYRQLNNKLTNLWDVVPGRNTLIIFSNGKYEMIDYQTLQKHFKNNDYRSITNEVDEVIKKLNK